MPMSLSDFSVRYGFSQPGTEQHPFNTAPSFMLTNEGGEEEEPLQRQQRPREVVEIDSEDSCSSFDS